MIKIEPFRAGESRYYDLDVDFHQPNNRPARVYVLYIGGWYEVEVRSGYMIEMRIGHSRLTAIGQLLELAAITGMIAHRAAPDHARDLFRGHGVVTVGGADQVSRQWGLNQICSRRRTPRPRFA